MQIKETLEENIILGMEETEELESEEEKKKRRYIQIHRICYKNRSRRK